jgi:lipase chaperone LimK
LNDGVSAVLLNDNSCAFEPGGDAAPEEPRGAFPRNVLNPFEQGFDDGTDFHKARPQIEKKTLARIREEEHLAELEHVAELKVEQIEIQLEQKQALPENRNVRRAIAALEAKLHKAQARHAEIQAQLARIQMQIRLREDEAEDEAMMMLLLAYH